MGMTNLGSTYGDATALTDSSETYYPGMHLDGEKAGMADGMEVGEERMMMAKVRLSSRSEHKDGDRSVHFEIIEADIGSADPEADAASRMYPSMKG